MSWISIIFILIGLALVVRMYLSGQKTTIVATAHQVPVPDGGLEAIEYFWRPG